MSARKGNIGQMIIPVMFHLGLQPHTICRPAMETNLRECLVCAVQLAALLYSFERFLPRHVRDLLNCYEEKKFVSVLTASHISS